MSDQYLGEIRLFSFGFAPANWAQCNGQLMPISQFQALFSLIGTTYGGNGTTTFALPNLQSRVPVHQGTGLGLSTYVMGQVGGTETVTLNQNQLPGHNHALQANDSPAAGSRPSGTVLARATSNIYGPGPDGTIMHPNAIGPAGGSQPHPNIQPYLVMNFCIALYGIYPPRD